MIYCSDTTCKSKLLVRGLDSLRKTLKKSKPKQFKNKIILRYVYTSHTLHLNFTVCLFKRKITKEMNTIELTTEGPTHVLSFHLRRYNWLPGWTQFNLIKPRYVSVRLGSDDLDHTLSCYAKEYPRNFSITCINNTTTYLGDDDFCVVDISVDGEVRVKAYAGYDCNDRGRNTSTVWSSFNVKGPYTFSHTKN